MRKKAATKRSLRTQTEKVLEAEIEFGCGGVSGDRKVGEWDRNQCLTEGKMQGQSCASGL